MSLPTNARWSPADKKKSQILNMALESLCRFIQSYYVGNGLVGIKENLTGGIIFGSLKHLLKEREQELLHPLHVEENQREPESTGLNGMHQHSCKRRVTSEVTKPRIQFKTSNVDLTIIPTISI